MLCDFAVPAQAAPRQTRDALLSGLRYHAAVWSPQALTTLMRRLDSGRTELAAIAASDLLRAWSETVESFLDRTSPERRALDPSLARLCRLSSQGLAAGLEAVLGGVRREPAGSLLEEAEKEGRTAAPGPVLVLLASNLPALAVQPLLPALALGRPVLLKSPSAEPLFAPAFVAALVRRQPRLATALAAITWRGGETELEAPLLAAAGRVLAYGEQETVDDLSRRAPGKVFGYGPKTSLAVVGAEVEPAAVASGLARDVALFDQRGCLSVAAVYTAGNAVALADALAGALGDLARRWPPGPVAPEVAAAVQQIRAEAEMRGLHRSRIAGGFGHDALAAGTVIVEPRPTFLPSPGLRTVRVQPLPEPTRLPRILAPWKGRLQGAALAGGDAWRLAAVLTSLGVSRTAPPGQLQSPDAAWHNGGVHPLTVLAG